MSDNSKTESDAAQSVPETTNSPKISKEQYLSIFHEIFSSLCSVGAEKGALDRCESIAPGFKDQYIQWLDANKDSADKISKEAKRELDNFFGMKAFHWAICALLNFHLYTLDNIQEIDALEEGIREKYKKWLENNTDLAWEIADKMINLGKGFDTKKYFGMLLKALGSEKKYP